MSFFDRREIVKVPLAGASAGLKSAVAQVEQNGSVGYAIMDNGILDWSQDTTCKQHVINLRARDRQVQENRNDQQRRAAIAATKQAARQCSEVPKPKKSPLSTLIFHPRYSLILCCCCSHCPVVLVGHFLSSISSNLC
jgi:hypothetical protein